MKIRLTSVELEEYKTIAECLRSKGFISNFEIVGEENNPACDERTITIRDLDTLSKPSVVSELMIEIFLQNYVGTSNAITTEEFKDLAQKLHNLITKGL